MKGNHPQMFVKKIPPAIHMVTAHAARERLVLAQISTGAKSNRITAIPALLLLLLI
jgi:hypothetical protein